MATRRTNFGGPVYVPPARRRLRQHQRSRPSHGGTRHSPVGDFSSSLTSTSWRHLSPSPGVPVGGPPTCIFFELYAVSMRATLHLGCVGCFDCATLGWLACLHFFFSSLSQESYLGCCVWFGIITLSSTLASGVSEHAQHGHGRYQSPVTDAAAKARAGRGCAAWVLRMRLWTFKKGQAVREGKIMSTLSTSSCTEYVVRLERREMPDSGLVSSTVAVHAAR